MKCSTTLMEKVAKVVGKEIANEVKGDTVRDLGEIEMQTRQMVQE